jgi:hypothetical protein
MFNIFCLKGKANKNYILIPFHPLKKKKKTRNGEAMRKKNPFYAVGGI